VYCKIYPLKVHTFEDRYYLVGIELGKAVAAENIKHFPIDRIHRRVDIALDDVSGASRSDSPVARNCAKNRRRNPHPNVRLRHTRCAKRFPKVRR
jgi:hypothetical protein